MRIVGGWRSNRVGFGVLLMFPAAAVASVSTKVRSALSNDVRRLPGVSMKSAQGRRFKDIAEAILVEFGAGADVTRVRELASLKFSHEMIQAQVIAGDLAKTDDLVRLSNLIARMERDLRRRKASRAAMTPPAHSLANIIARHQREAAEKAAAGADDNGDGR
ncbi:hypothetical protein IYX23_05645 [Methylocystis sp. L43]|jgi:hypothetical protein|uniref:hypothetical protein n=1 Tax=unclassified Methylocystis TaxID=2625913 RepID=UPI0018C34FC3|nr:MULTISPECIES: hypothetical protein [unclassified Methylocystis]MBG0797170.1 hypothetical protein [Methylocystis sp. L43]MBG0804959.1 hypothetical protein [Methylocystis sp. H15]